MSAAPIHHKWQEIADLPADLEQFRGPELESLYQVWLEQKDTGDQKSFAAELAREWSIETGIIEGVYTLDRGVTQTLIERGISSSYIPHGSTNRDPELVARTIQAHEEALEGLFGFVAGGRELTTGYIKELHAALLKYQDTVVVFDQFGNKFETELKKGLYKQHPNNPQRPDGSLHEYCPPEHVASEMDRLIEFHGKHEQRSVPALVEAAWLHHAFTQIHPFQDGNGRVARALASLVLIKAGFFPLVVHRDDWEKYIDALEAADEGDLSPLVNLFSTLQKRDLTKAMIYTAEARPVRTVDDAIAVTKDVLAGVAKLPANARAESERLALQLRDLARARLKETALGLEQALKVRFRAELSPIDRVPAATLALEANAVGGRIVVEFGTGSRRGLVVAGAEFRSMSAPPIPLYDDAFHTDHLEPTDELRPRFLKWLDDVIIRGLAEWRKTLV